MYSLGGSWRAKVKVENSEGTHIATHDLDVLYK
jgi:hypothetical protein